jgi:hypothetical protein
MNRRFRWQRKKKRQLKKHQVAESIPEGPLVEILSRVPYSSLCRFKCVSRSWLALCSDPDIRKRSPQTLSGFFHNYKYGSLEFRNLSGRGPPMVDPSLPFLGDYASFTVQQCCRGLLLCSCSKPGATIDDFDLVVCNPATHKYSVLPPLVFLDEEAGGDPACFLPMNAFLGFDTAAPSRFVVVVLLAGCPDNVAVYSSAIGRWIRRAWDHGAVPVVTAECVFLNGFIHSPIHEPYIAVVGTKGETMYWSTIPLPEAMEPSNGSSSMGQSQGLLHAWYIDPEDYQLSVWVLEDYKIHIWTLKHNVNVLELLDTQQDDGGFYEVFAIHPEQNMIFINNGEDTTISYNMDTREVCVMCTSGEFMDGLPYIPCFAE